jgi:hypothetical protein
MIVAMERIAQVGREQTPDINESGRRVDMKGRQGAKESSIEKINVNPR